MTDVRASDAEREATISRLRDAAAEGRLTFEELADRIEAASAAVMRSDLVPLTADLPVSVAPIDDTPEHVRTVGEIKRTGTWAVPAETAFRTWFGDVKLDLRRARISSTEIRIHAWSLFGDIDLLVPEGVLVDVLRQRQARRRQAGAERPRAGRARDRPHRRHRLRRHQGPPQAAVGEAGLAAAQLSGARCTSASVASTTVETSGQTMAPQRGGDLERHARPAEQDPHGGPSSAGGRWLHRAAPRCRASSP